MIVPGVCESEDSPISCLKELAGHQVGVDSEQAAVSVTDQRGLLEVLRGGQELREAGGQQGQQQQGGEGGELGQGFGNRENNRLQN